MSHCLVRILIQGHNWAIFFFENEQGVTITFIGLCLTNFCFAKIEEEDIGNIWFHQDGATCNTDEAILDVLRPVFEDHIISRKTDIVWTPRSCDLTPSDCADKPEIIDHLKDNIRGAIGQIQLHTIDNVLKNRTDRVGYCLTI